MKNVFKKLVAVLMTGSIALTMVACGGSGNSSSVAAGADTQQAATQGKATTIGVAYYKDSGLDLKALKAYLNSISGSLNTTFKYTVLSQTDEAANVTEIQKLISSGVDGIISTMDLGTSSIIEECEAAGIYLGGYLCDYDTSYSNAFDKVFKSEYFVGTSSDGQNPDEPTLGTTMFDSLMNYNEGHGDAPITHVSMTTFPAWAFPAQAAGAEQFVSAVEEYNKTADVQIEVDALDEESDVLKFSPLDSTYFLKHSETQAIMSFAAGTSFVYPVMVQAGVDKKIKLFTTGFSGGEDTNFGSVGTQTYQQTTVTAVESINYALVLLLNKINGTEFADQPEDAERISVSQLIINSDESMEKFKQSLYYSGDASKAMFTGEDVLNMTAYANPDATYANLKDSLAHMTIDNLK